MTMPENRLEVQQTQKLSQSLQTVIHLLSLDLDDLSSRNAKSRTGKPGVKIPAHPLKSPHDYTLMVKNRYYW